MAEFILGYAKDLDLKGFWDESEYLHNFIIKNSSAVEKKHLASAYNNIGGIYSNKGEWDKAYPIIGLLHPYCDNTSAWSVTYIKGYGARLSAPGYMDCTEWAVFDTEEEAQEYLVESYDLCPECLSEWDWDEEACPECGYREEE